MKKKGAIELSIGTIVVIVLAMSMLILGLVLVKNIFLGSTENILQINDAVEDQINKLFVEDKRTVVYLSNQIAKIKQDEEWGVAFAIKNTIKGNPDVSQFTYEVRVSDPDLTAKFGIGQPDVMSWIRTGRADTVAISPGDVYYGIVRFLIPDTAPLCIIRFHIEVMQEGKLYATDFFDVEVES